MNHKIQTENENESENENENKMKYDNANEHTPNRVEEDAITLNRCRSTMQKIVNAANSRY